MQIDITETNFVRALAAGLLPADEALIRCAQRLVGWLPPQQAICYSTSDEDMRQAIRNWCLRYGAPNAPRLMARFNITNVTQLSQEKRQAFVAACDMPPTDTVDEFFAKLEGGE